jgi:N-formylglutamate amidohydrolase
MSPLDPSLALLTLPASQSLPLVVAVPHAGRDYGPHFTASILLGADKRRITEDAFADELAALAPERGAPLLRALFPRIWLDVNRDQRELDPLLIRDELPAGSLPTTANVRAGLGVVPRLLTGGRPIYSTLLSLEEIESRLALGWRPYHETLKALVEETRQRLKHCILIDCHSMPTSRESDPPDIVLGDSFGSACDNRLVSLAELFFKRLGFRVIRNKPYAGGFTTRHYGQPNLGVHALQIEIRRGLYMNEQRFEPSPALPELASHLGELFRQLGSVEI